MSVLVGPAKSYSVLQSAEINADLCLQIMSSVGPRSPIMIAGV